MSVQSSTRNRRRVLRGLAVVVVVTGTTVSTVSARGSSDQASLEARTAAAGASAQAVSVPAVGQILGGFTSQGWPVVIKLSKNHKRIADVRIGLRFNCTSGIRFAGEDGRQDLPISASGRVRSAEMIPPSPGSSASLTGGMTSFSGKLDRKHSTFSGVWQLRLTFSMSNGQTDQCDTGRVTFAAAL
jgi:hypothetical protein